MTPGLSYRTAQGRPAVRAGDHSGGRMWSPRFRRSDVSEAALKWELGDTDAVGCAGGADDSGTKPARRVAQLNRLSVRLSMTSRCRGRLRARAARSACSRREPVIAMPTRLVGPTAANDTLRSHRLMSSGQRGRGTFQRTSHRYGEPSERECWSRMNRCLRCVCRPPGPPRDAPGVV